MRPRAILFLLPLLSALAAAADGKEKFRLAGERAAGDVVTVEYTLERTMDVTEAEGAKETPDLKWVQRYRTKYTSTVLDDRGAKGWSVRRVYEVKRGFEKLPSGKEEHAPSSLQGMTVTITYDGKKISVTPAAGKLDPKDRQELIEEFETPDAADFYTDREVAVGDTWTLSGHAAGLAVRECRLAGVVQHAGHRCARIGIIFERDQRTPAPSMFPGQLEGSAHYALDLRRPVGSEMTGTFAVWERRKDGERSVDLRGHGTWSEKRSFAWQKVAGKPVPAGKEPAKPG
jgi:hypothetical protein